MAIKSTDDKIEESSASSAGTVIKFSASAGGATK
jgi:beta-lactam-binding protein with PASTA domain